VALSRRAPSITNLKSRGAQLKHPACNNILFQQQSIPAPVRRHANERHIATEPRDHFFCDQFAFDAIEVNARLSILLMATTIERLPPWRA
jgi:hypothetical protein